MNFVPELSYKKDNFRRGVHSSWSNSFFVLPLVRHLVRIYVIFRDIILIRRVVHLILLQYCLLWFAKENAHVESFDTRREISRWKRGYLNMISESCSAAAEAHPSGMKRQLLSGCGLISFCRAISRRRYSRISLLEVQTTRERS